MQNQRTAYCIMGLLLLVFSGNASADWARFWEDTESATYLDRDTLAKSADSVSIWILKDFHQVQIGPSREKFRSAKIYYEFKCNEKLVRQSYLTRHYGPIGGGGSLSSDARFYPWIPIVPGTEKAKLFDFACS